MIYILIHNVNNFAVVMTANREQDFKNEYLFRTRSVATNLITSIEFLPIRCATVLCHFGQTRNGSVAIHFILVSSTAMK